MMKWISSFLIFTQIAGPGSALAAPKTRFQQSVSITGALDVTGNSTAGGTHTVTGAGAVGGALSVGTTSAADSKSILDITSTTKGVLFPRMTTTQRDNISSPTTGLIVYNTTTSQLNQYNGTSWVAVGSGTGAGATNYISGNPDAETGTTGWSTFADAAATTPADGTGGSPSHLTLTRSTSTPLRGTGSFLLTNSGSSSAQGEGVSYDFTIDEADKAKALSVKFDYTPASGTFVSGDSSDLRVYLYDVTNAVVIQPAPYTIQGGTGSNHQFKATFQTSSNSTSYRLIFFVATTATSAWTFKFDNVLVGPESSNYGAPISDWATYTPTGTWATNTTYTGKYRRVGDSLQVQANVALSGAPTGNFSLDLPSGLSIDTSKLSITTDGAVGVASGDAAGTNYTGTVKVNSSTSVYVVSNGTATRWNATSPNTWANTNTASVNFIVPISGWSSTVLMSNDTDTRVVAARYRQTSGQSINSTTFTVVTNLTKDEDTHSAMNATTGVYTIPVPGWYRLSMSVGWDNQLGSGTYIALAVKKNSTSAFANLQHFFNGGAYARPTGHTTLYLVAGDTIAFEAYQETGSAKTTSGTGAYNWVAIERLSGTSAVAATEAVLVQANTTTGQSLSGGYANNAVIYTNKVKDTHNAYSTSTGIFTAPVSGTYEICASYVYASRTWATSDDFYMAYKKNSTQIYQRNFYRDGAVTNAYHAEGRPIMIPLLAGETLSVAEFHGPATTYSLTNTQSDFLSSLTIKRVGNY